jgi:hypothetical protein
MNIARVQFPVRYFDMSCASLLNMVNTMMECINEHSSCTDFYMTFKDGVTWANADTDRTPKENQDIRNWRQQHNIPEGFVSVTIGTPGFSKTFSIAQFYLLAMDIRNFIQHYPPMIKLCFDQGGYRLSFLHIDEQMYPSVKELN